MAATPLNIGFIGAGNMGEALLAGLIRTGHAAQTLGFAESSPKRAQALQQRYPGLQQRSVQDLTASSATLVLAVKPQTLPNLAPDLRAAVQQQQPLVVSVAAGVSCKRLTDWLGHGVRLIRAMPNTPALVGAGMTGLFATPQATTEDRATANALFAAVGQCLWLDDEDHLHAVTATSGSGPAYVFLLLEAMQAAAQSLGLTPEIARHLSLQTVLGAAQLAQSSAAPPAQLRAQVTSPGGTTERAIQHLQEGQFTQLMHAAMAAAAQRSRDLAD